MGELGPRAEQFHCDVARYAALSGIEQCWFVGPHAPAQVEEFARHGAAVKASAFADNAAAIVACLTDPAVDATLVKGSRSAGMEAIVAALCGPAINGEGH
jgi:UDP-N-acetylmuramoyl-tripeptide--D-alanyl-D-alanine ligase